MQQLIDDVQAGNTDFTVVLVYDVSRWGRFQDAYESACYEAASQAGSGTTVSNISAHLRYSRRILRVMKIRTL